MHTNKHRHKINPSKKCPSPSCDISSSLAARLKALGFASSAAKSSPPSGASVTASILQDRGSGLVQHQARQLEQSHQAGSAPTLIIERRGRPWKGTLKGISSTVANALHRKPSFESTKSTKSPDSPFDCTDILLPSPTHEVGFPYRALASPALISSNHLAPPLSPHSPSFPTMLPEIDASAAFDQDTDKYIMPENDITPDLRLDRQHMPPQPPLTITPAESVVPQPPPPPPKDMLLPAKNMPPSLTQSASISSMSSEYFSGRHERAVSIYTLSRVSFANQLAQLTSLQLPDADSLSSKVAAIPTAYAANNALINAAEQIRGWIAKAAEVIEGLDSDDDVEWAAAGGREGLSEVEKAILRFEELINIYVSAIEDMQCRPDISEVSPNDLNKAVIQMESILSEWMRIRTSLQAIKEQVEIAMEWQELWNNVLGDIQNEMDELSRLVFEMEERRHKSLMAANDGVDIGDLETIVEEVPTASRLQAQGRFNAPPLSPGSPGTPALTLDDSSLLALFARMQPLRASLEFVPMRLSVFEMRARPSFPTACDELEMRRTALDGCYKKLEKDAESLRKELGEDKWVDVFRNAGRQAQKMYESVHRSVDKLQEAIKSGNQPVIAKKIEGYEAKKMHYGPAIERVLSIIDKGVKDRLTVNGEILRLHAETQIKWEELKKDIAEMDLVLEEVQSEFKSQQLRDSISSLLSSNDRASTVGSNLGTPGTSPPDSVIMSTGPSSKTSSTPFTKRTRASTASSVPQNRRYSSVPPSNNTGTSTPRKTTADRRSVLATPTSSMSRLSRSPSIADMRPKWNGSVNTRDLDTGHNFKPLTLTTPSPYAKRSPSTTPGATNSSLSLSPSSGSAKVSAMRFSASSRSRTASPAFDVPPRNSSRASFRDRINSAVNPGPYSQVTIQKTRAMSQSSASQPPAVSGSTQQSVSTRDARRASLQPRMASNSSSTAGGGGMSEATLAAPVSGSRPTSSLSFNPRRSSMLPLSRSRAGSTDGRNSPQPRTGSRLGLRRGTESKDSKPRWRF
ncbi:hypothetical protein TD95_000621 [Thielaviopsis punctulata]|uniref:Karyogamy protein n=1 Tax=Thielaviopsis punctulata TaxID=72032 RepID=A0A0F4ZJZ8_9PEZI|nr:hypothetical protein TD95_000621 [Thielaviopsis punctulata]